MNINSYLRDFNEYRTRLFIVTGCMVAAAVMGWLITVGRLEIKSLIVILAGFIVGLFLVRSNDRALRGSYFLAVVTFAAGHRSLYVGRSSFFVPAELIVWALFFLLLARSAVEHRWLGRRLPKPLVFLVAWCLLGVTWTPDLFLRWDDAFPMVKLWVFALPAFVVTGALVTEAAHLRRILKILIIVALYMSTLAIVEYAFPSITSGFPWLFNAKLALIDTDQGFARAVFSFWGNPIGVIIIGWGMLAAFDELMLGSGWIWKVVAFAALATGFAAVYISGQRASWISVPFGVAVLAFLSKKRRLSVAVLIALFAPVLFFPASFWLRFASILPSSSNFLTDSSSVGRLDRYQEAIGQALSNPITGVGLTGGLVHNEFLSFGAHLGLPAMVAFIILLWSMGTRLGRLYFHPPSAEFQRLAALFLAMFATWLVDLNFHPALGVAPVTIPYWLMLALAWYLPTLKGSRQTGRANSPDPFPIATPIDGDQQT